MQSYPKLWITIESYPKLLIDYGKLSKALSADWKLSTVLIHYVKPSRRVCSPVESTSTSFWVSGKTRTIGQLGNWAFPTLDVSWEHQKSVMFAQWFRISENSSVGSGAPGNLGTPSAPGELVYLCSHVCTWCIWYVPFTHLTSFTPYWKKSIRTTRLTSPQVEHRDSSGRGTRWFERLPRQSNHHHPGDWMTMMSTVQCGVVWPNGVSDICWQKLCFVPRQTERSR